VLLFPPQNLSQIFLMLRRIQRHIIIIFFPAMLRPNAGPGSLHPCGSYVTHNDSSQSVRLLWMNDQLVSETFTWQHTTLTSEKHPWARRNSNHTSKNRAAADLRVRPRVPWGRALKVCIGPHIKHLLFLSDFKENQIFSTMLQKY
jgi:hypothetical protein